MKSFKPSYVASSNDYAEFKKEKRKEQTKDALFRIGVVGSSVYASKLLLDTDAGQSAANKLFKGHALKQLYQFENGNFFDTKINKRINLGDISLNAARAAEELSPFKILRTFHVSSFLFPIASGTNAKTTISADLIDLDIDYYRGLIKKYGTGLHQNTIDMALSQGLVLDAGKLKTKAGETLIEHARLVHLNSDIAGASHDNSAGAFVNRIYEKFRNVTGIRSNSGFDDILKSDLHKVGIIAGNSTKEIYGNWTRSYIRMAMEPAYKLVNKPMEFLTEYIDHIGHAVNPTWKSISEKFGMNILPERFVGSTREALWTIAKKGAIRSAQAKVGFVLADAAVRTLAPNTSAYSKGLLEGLATFAVNTHIKFAETWSDNFQELKQKQEDLAPGSTSLFTLAGFPLAGAMAGGTLGYLKRAGHIGANGSQIGALLARYNTEATTVISEKLALSFKARPVAKWAFLGALAASLPALPYLPGALVGKSSEELKREYSGEKEVAVRTNRWWASGSYEYEGTKIKYFRPHTYSSMINNSSDLTIYGSQANEDRLNPVLHPFDYLRNPYRLEQQNASKTPYPVWGMDVSYGGFFGKIFEKTAGRIIKPDKLNPKILAAKDAYQESVDKQLSYTTDYNGFAIDSDINDFKQKSMSSAQDRGSLAALIKEREKEYGKFAGILDKNAVGGDAPEVEGLRSEYASMVNLENYNVTVDDADTVILEDKTGKEKRKIEIRLSGMDSPEVGGHENDPIDFLRFKQEQLYGKEATDILKKIFSEQSNISLAINKTEMSYGRYVGVLIGDNNKNLNLEVIKKGGATILPWGNTDLIKTKDLKAAEREAQSTAEGLWNLPRYQAVQLFNQMTGYRQTYNTLTRIDKLAMRPELASYVTYLNSLDSQKEELSQSQKEDIQKLAMYYNKSSKDNREMGNLLKNIGMTVSGDQITANGGGFLKGALVNGATALINQGFNLNSTEAQTFTVRKNVKDSEKQLIEGDMMYAPQSPTYSPHTEGIKFSYSSFTEFSGSKGWAGSLLADALGFDYKDKPTELARSGEATGIARRVKDLNLGGALGGTEFLRRALPQSGDTLYDRENPMQNDMPCLIAGTEVLMSSGILKNAEDLQIGDCLVSDTGKDVYVTNIASMASDREITIDIYGNNLYQLKFSWNHPILNNKMQYVNAEDIKSGDFVAYPRRQYMDNSKTIDLCIYLDNVKHDDEFIYYGKGNKIKISRFWKDVDLFYLVGVYAAEGSERNKNKSFKLAGHINDKWELRIVDIFNKYNIRYGYEEKGNSRNYHSYCVPLLNVLKILCPGNCYTKSIHPDIISRTNSKYAIQQLLKGIIDGDGYYCMSADGRIKTGLHTTSKSLAYQTRNIIVDLYGYNPATTAEYRQDRSIIAIHVMCSGAQAQKLAEKLEYDLYDTYIRKSSHTNYCDDNYIYIKVRAVSTEYKDTIIYAQEVSGNHTFCVSVFATHNTWLPSKADDFYTDFRTGNPYCVSSDTNIEIDNMNIKSASDVSIGDIITTHTGKNAPVVNIVKRQIKPNEKCYELGIYKIKETYKMSEEHPVYIYPGIWKEMQYIQNEDIVGYPIQTIEQMQTLSGHIDISLYAKSHHIVTSKYIYIRCSTDVAFCYEFIENHNGVPFNKIGELSRWLINNNIGRKSYEYAQQAYKAGKIIRVPRYINSDSDDFATLCGYYIAEGSSSDDSVNFAFHINETQYHNEVLNAYRRLFHNQKGKVYKAGDTNGSQVIIGCQFLPKIMEDYCGKYFNQKTIEKCINTKTYKSLIRAIFNGDGSFFITAKNKVVLNLKLINPKLLRQIRKVLLADGYISSVTECSLSIYGSDAVSASRFYDTKTKETNFIKETHKTCFIENNYLWSKIRYIKNIEIDYVYGFEVNIDDSFCLVGLATHNTKIEQGEIRLPGAGYESRFKELQGLDPKDYPDIHKYKILADVAMGSTQYYNMKDRMDARHRAGTLTDYEENLYKTITEQTQERGIFKQFDPYKTDEDLKGYGELDRLKSSFWQTVTHNSENPLEPLTFFRPAGKFIHKRTATEDYVSSQILGNDMAMWTKPYAHMIKPTINKLTAIGNENFIPQETKERRNIDEYFEALDYIKKRKLYKQYIQDGNIGEAEIVKGQYLSNPFGAITMNLGSDKEMTKSYIAFNSKDRQYYSAFSSERNPEEREKIINMLPAVQAELMSKIWKRRDTIQNSQDNNKDISESIHNLIIEEHAQTVDNNKDAYKRYKNSDAARHSSFEEYLSDEAAEKIVTRRTGMPSEDFIGWDPRIDINDIKLKTLMIGKEDVREFGFWQSDEDKVNRMFVLENNSKQMDNINAIKRDMQSANMDREIIKNRLYKAGIKVSSMSSSPALDDNVDIFIE